MIAGQGTRQMLVTHGVAFGVKHVVTFDVQRGVHGLKTNNGSEAGMRLALRGFAGLGSLHVAACVFGGLLATAIGCQSQADDALASTSETHDAPAASATPAPPAVDLTNGGVDLLQDPTLADWRAIWAPGQRSTLPEHFAMADGILTTQGNTNAAIVTTQQWDAPMTLSFDWRWTGEAGNGGVMLLAQPNRGALFVTGLEIQLRIGEAGDLYGVGMGIDHPDTARTVDNRILRDPAAGNPEKPTGEWNRTVVACLPDGTVQVWLNGVLVNQATGLDRPGGRIAIQAEDVSMQFKNVHLHPRPRN